MGVLINACECDSCVLCTYTLSSLWWLSDGCTPWYIICHTIVTSICNHQIHHVTSLPNQHVLRWAVQISMFFHKVFLMTETTDSTDKLHGTGPWTVQWECLNWIILLNDRWSKGNSQTSLYGSKDRVSAQRHWSYDSFNLTMSQRVYACILQNSTVTWLCLNFSHYLTLTYNKNNTSLCKFYLVEASA